MPKSIAVLGAGAAGLSCARSLVENGFDVTVHEARNRIGGRIHESAALGKTVDLGPNWMHGDTEDNSALKYFKRPNVVLHDIGASGTIFSPDGDMYSPDEVDRIEEYMWAYVERAIAYSKDHCESIHSGVSLYDYVSDLVAQSHSEDSRMADHIKMAVEIFGFYIGNDVRSQSLKFAFLEEPAPGENLYVASGFKAILNSIAEGVLEKLTLKLGSVVTAVETSDAGKVCVVADSGHRYSYDAVVCAVPLGVLKHRAISFTLELPPRLESAIDSLAYGRLEKVYIKFPRRFWNMDYFEFFSPTYAAESNPQRWPMSVISLGHLPEPYDQPVLLWYLYGEMSETVLNMARDEDRLLFFEPYFSRIPGYDAERDAPEGIVYTSWSRDPFAGFGSYSNFLVGLEDGDHDIAELRKGLPDRRLWFAGEHCSNIVELATVGGAVGSGEYAASLVVQHFKL